jgi:hypothetical protein
MTPFIDTRSASAAAAVAAAATAATSAAAAAASVVGAAEFQALARLETAHWPLSRLQKAVLGAVAAANFSARRRRLVERLFAQLDPMATGAACWHQLNAFFAFLRETDANADDGGADGLGTEAGVAALLLSMDFDGDGAVSLDDCVAYFARLGEVTCSSRDWPARPPDSLTPFRLLRFLRPRLSY